MIDSVFPELFENDGNGHLSLRDRVFTDLDIGYFGLLQNNTFKSVTMENVCFKNCNILNNRLSVYGSVLLKNVELNNLKCKEYHFDPLVQLDNVALIGGKGASAWLKNAIDVEDPTYPDIPGLKLTHPTSEIGVCFDFTKFLGDLIIYHAHPNNIRLNSNLHFVVDKKRINLEYKNLKSDKEAQELLRSLKWYAEESETGYFFTSILDIENRIDLAEKSAVESLRKLGIID